MRHNCHYYFSISNSSSSSIPNRSSNINSNRGGKDTSASSAPSNTGPAEVLGEKSKGPSVLCSLHVHTDAYSKEDVILNRDVFPTTVSIGDYVKIFRQDAPKAKLVVKVSVFHTRGGLLEVSLSKTLADVLQVR